MSISLFIALIKYFMEKRNSQLLTKPKERLSSASFSTFKSAIPLWLWGTFLLCLLPCHIFAINSTHDGTLKEDTLLNFVTEGLHVVHLRVDFFGDEYRYSLTEQEENLHRNYSEKESWAMLADEEKEVLTNDMLQLHAQTRDIVIRMKQKRILKWKYHLGMTFEFNAQGNIIHVCITSHHPIGHKRMRLLLQEVCTYKFHAISTPKDRGHYWEGGISLGIPGSSERDIKWLSR